MNPTTPQAPALPAEVALARIENVLQGHSYFCRTGQTSPELANETMLAIRQDLPLIAETLKSWPTLPPSSPQAATTSVTGTGTGRTDAPIGQGAVGPASPQAALGVRPVDEHERDRKRDAQHRLGRGCGRLRAYGGRRGIHSLAGR